MSRLFDGFTAGIFYWWFSAGGINCVLLIQLCHDGTHAAPRILSTKSGSYKHHIYALGMCTSLFLRLAAPSVQQTFALMINRVTLRRRIWPSISPLKLTHQIRKRFPTLRGVKVLSGSQRPQFSFSSMGLWEEQSFNRTNESLKLRIRCRIYFVICGLFERSSESDERNCGNACYANFSGLLRCFLK